MKPDRGPLRWPRQAGEDFSDGNQPVSFTLHGFFSCEPDQTTAAGQADRRSVEQGLNHIRRVRHRWPVARDSCLPGVRK